MRPFDTKKMAALSVMTATAIAIHGAESMLPVLLPIPGLRLGLSNIVTLALLKRYGPKDAALVLFLRILLASLLFGQWVSLMYSLGGGILCLVGEILIDRILAGKRLYITSAFGGILHNVGQLAVARLILKSSGVWIYLPYLILGGILTGLFVGFASGFLLRLLPRQEGY